MQRYNLAKVTKSDHGFTMPRLTPNAAAERSGQSRTTILRAVAAGELAATKHHNRWAISVDDLDTWSAQRPLTAGRSAKGRFERGQVMELPQIPPSSPERASGSAEDWQTVIERLQALETLCASLSAKMEEIGGHTGSTISSSASTEPDVIAQARRRLWPFSANK